MNKFLVCYAFTNKSGYGYGHIFVIRAVITEENLNELKRELEIKNEFTNLTFTSVAKVSPD